MRSPRTSPIESKTCFMATSFQDVHSYKKRPFLEDQSTPLTFLWATTRTYGTDRIPESYALRTLKFEVLRTRVASLTINCLWSLAAMFNISFTGFPLFSTRGSTSVTQVCQPARSGAGLRIRPKQLANQRREGHVDGGIKVHSLRACVISQHLHRDRRIVSDNHAGLHHSQDAGNTFGLTEGPGGVDRRVYVIPGSRRRDRGEGQADLDRDRSSNELLATGRCDGLHDARFVPGVHCGAVDNLDAGQNLGQLGNRRRRTDRKSTRLNSSH